MTFKLLEALFSWRSVLDVPAIAALLFYLYLEHLRRTTPLTRRITAPPDTQPVEKNWPEVEVRLEIVR